MARLDGAVRDRDVLLPRQPQLCQARTSRDAQLRGDQIDACRLLSDRVLDLDARVDLDEDRPSALGQQELDSACAAVAARRAEGEGVAEHPAALSRTEAEGRRHLDELLPALLAMAILTSTLYLLWRYLDELLPASLYRAVTLIQVHEPALPVAEQLHLDVSRLVEGRGWRVGGGGSEVEDQEWRVRGGGSG